MYVIHTYSHTFLSSPTVWLKFERKGGYGQPFWGYLAGSKSVPPSGWIRRQSGPTAVESIASSSGNTLFSSGVVQQLIVGHKFADVEP